MTTTKEQDLHPGTSRFAHPEYARVLDWNV